MKNNHTTNELHRQVQPGSSDLAAESCCKQKQCYRYDWLRMPAILLLIIGMIGILSAKLPYFQRAFSFCKLPPFISSVIILILSGILLLIALFGKGPQPSGESEADNEPKTWRSF